MRLPLITSLCFALALANSLIAVGHAARGDRGWVLVYALVSGAALFGALAGHG